MSTRGRGAAAVSVVLVAALAGLLLWPDGEAVRRLLLDVYLVGLRHGVPPRVGPEVYAAALNVLVFVPLGWIGVALLRRGVVTVAGGLLLLSATVEAVQALPVLGRVPSVLDVACNAAGGLVGAVLASVVVGRGRDDEDTGVDEAGDEVLHPGPDDRD
ncbi:MAG TPA: VanZ family protein [Ornithinibacter sp.]|nr:VanZ family protein [Ornithinibacter sp.]